ncbi:MAG: hypothetical protein ABIL06_22690 [Pseudomonadota bacterium]
MTNGSLTAHLLAGCWILVHIASALARAGDRETLLMGEIKPQQVEQVRSDMPFLKDRKSTYFFIGPSI